MTTLDALRCNDDAYRAVRALLDETPELAAMNTLDRDHLADRITVAVWTELDREGQRSRRLIFDENGNGFCSHCGRMGCNASGEKPNPPPGHFQYGITYICTEPTDEPASIP